MSGIQEFVCDPCGQAWHDRYTFWRGYLSPCPRCGKQCQAFCDTQVYKDQQEMERVFDGPLFDFEGQGDERTEDDLEGEREQIHDEIAEALGATESDTSDADEDSDTDEDADSGEGL